MNIKHFLFLLIFISFSSQINAQNDFRLGFKANPLISTLKPNSDFHSSVGSKVGFSYGLLFDYFLKENYAFSSEFAISKMGGKTEYVLADTTISSDISISYIEIPLTIKLKTNEIKNGMKIYGKFGLGLGFNIKSSASLDYKIKSNSVYKDDIKNATKYTQGLNTSLIVGGGIEYSLAENLDLVLGLTYSNGFLNVMKSNTIFRDQNNLFKRIDAFDANLNYLALNVGLLF